MKSEGGWSVTAIGLPSAPVSSTQVHSVRSMPGSRVAVPPTGAAGRGAGLDEHDASVATITAAAASEGRILLMDVMVPPKKTLRSPAHPRA
jgi:hypothetical protein